LVRLDPVVSVFLSSHNDYLFLVALGRRLVDF
jgi:hypothetical protein